MQTSKLSTLKLKPLKVLTFLAIAFPVLLLGFLMSAEFLSDTSAEQINVNIGDGAYTMSIAADNLSVDIDATPSGVQRSVQKDIQVTTNSGTGYKLYLAMDNDNTNGNRLYYNGNTMSTSYIQPTSSATLGTNTWGYSMDGSSWAAVPLKGSEALIGSSATTPAGAVTHSVYYGFNVNNTLPFGQYKGAVTYTLVGDAAATPKAYATVMNAVDDGTIANTDGGDTLVITTSLMTNMENIGNVTVTVGGSSCPVTGVTTKDKYVEVQCTMPAKEVGTYNVAVSIPKFDKTYDTTVNYVEKFWTISKMQEMTSDICNQVYTPSNATGSSVTIIDEYNTYKSTVTAANQPYVAQRILSDVRDGKNYTIRKLADGNCWMVQNLDLDLVAGNALDNTTTDIGYGGSGNISWTPTNSTLSSSASKSWVNVTDVAMSYDPGDIWFPATSTTSQTPQYTQGDTPSTQHAGNLYNWYALTAGQGPSAGSTGTATDSICPKGWQLDTAKESSAAGTKSAYKLYRSTYGFSSQNTSATAFAKAQSLPLSLVESGLVDGTNGYYWAGTSGHYASARSMDADWIYWVVFGYANDSSDIRFQIYSGGWGKHASYSVRCVNR